MTLDLVSIKAEDAIGEGYGFFIYQPKTHTFFYVDDVEYNGEKCRFFFEECIYENGLREFYIDYKPNDIIIIFNPKSLEAIK